MDELKKSKYLQQELGKITWEFKGINKKLIKAIMIAISQHLQSKYRKKYFEGETTEEDWKAERGTQYVFDEWIKLVTQAFERFIDAMKVIDECHAWLTTSKPLQKGWL